MCGIGPRGSLWRRVRGSSFCAKVRDLDETIENPAGATQAVLAETEEIRSPAVPVTQQLDTSTVKLIAILSEDKMARQQRSSGCGQIPMDS